MSAHDDMDRVEQLLRSAPAPAAVPPGLIDVAREAALGGPERRTVVAVSRPRVPRLRLARFSAGVAVMAAAAAAALIIGVGGRGPSFDSQGTLSLAGPAGAAATVDFGSATQGTRPMLLKIHDLRPAPSGSYYEMWFNVGGDKVSAVTFNTSASGRATVRTAISSNMHWGSCWVTLEKVGGGDNGRVVLRST
jgi:Anti-sigma-K factor rskA, C-terminal